MDVSEGAILADMHALARAHTGLIDLAANDNFDVPVGDGGRWVGRCIENRKDRTLIARTYLSADR